MSSNGKGTQVSLVGGTDSNGGPTISVPYLEAVTLIERLHRRLLDVVKDDFDRRGRADVNAVQALMLYHIGDSVLSAGELRSRGYYLGSNVSYNLKKMVETGFLRHERCKVDRRSVRISLDQKGQEVRKAVEVLFAKHCLTIEKVGEVSAKEFEEITRIMRRLDRFWVDHMLYRL